MELVIFDNGRYDYCDGSNIIFHANDTHDFLFDYVSENSSQKLAQLSALLEEYVSKKMDIKTFRLKKYKYKDSDSVEIIEILKSLHPYYKHEYKKIFVKAIGEYFNSLLFQAKHERLQSKRKNNCKSSYDYDGSYTPENRLPFQSMDELHQWSNDYNKKNLYVIKYKIKNIRYEHRNSEIQGIRRIVSPKRRNIKTVHINWYSKRFRALAVIKVYEAEERVKELERLDRLVTLVTPEEKEAYKEAIYQKYPNPKGSIKKERLNELKKLDKFITLEEKKAYLEQIEKKYSEFYNIDDYVDEFYKKYNPDNIEENAIQNIVALGFSNELKTHDHIKRMLFWLLDISVPSIGKLTIPQRVWLYCNVFILKNDQYEMDVMKKLSLWQHGEGDDTIYKVKPEEEPHGEKTRHLFHPIFNLKNFHKSQETITSETLNVLNDAAEYAKQFLKKEIYDKYEITNLYQLLFLEIQSMVKLNTKVKKCQNCGMYFIDDRKDYCERINEGETQPCSKIGAKRTYQNKLKETPVLEIYERAREAHRERYRRIEKNQDYSKEKKQSSKVIFESWNRDAKEKLEQVKAGKLSELEFMKWITLNGKK